MVNASLNWASIVGIVLAVCGGGLYFLRSFKPALARDYDVFFAAIGLLCGGILFFQGWRLDPILQFGQFLLAGTTVFFAYESVRLRGIATDQARKSAFFEDEQIPNIPRGPSRNRWDDEYDQFEQSERQSRRFKSRDIDRAEEGDDFVDERYRSRRLSRTIPESAVSRRRESINNNDLEERELNRRRRSQVDKDDLEERELNRRRRFKVDKDLQSSRNNFGERRNMRNESRRGSRPLANENTSRQGQDFPDEKSSNKNSNLRSRSGLRSQTAKSKVEDASFIDNDNSSRRVRKGIRTSRTTNSSPKNSSRYNVASKKGKPRDNSSRFDN